MNEPFSEADLGNRGRCLVTAFTMHWVHWLVGDPAPNGYLEYARFVNPEDNPCSRVQRRDDLLGLVDLLLESLNFVSQLGYPSGN